MSTAPSNAEPSSNAVSPPNGLRLFRALGIDVYLHWSWFIVAVFEVQLRHNEYTSQFWNVLEYLTLFAIVLLHEFGHALACRSVGGTVHSITLWPLGGVALVSPPPRPGAWLWSIAAGPLVNLALVPVLLGAYFLVRFSGLEISPDALQYLKAASILNAVLFLFNVLPIYPLDGGKILQSVLWYFVGRARSLVIATVVGLIGAVALGILAVASANPLLGLIIVFMAMGSWRELKRARTMVMLEKLPRHDHFTCAACGIAPPQLEVWQCECKQRFDPFVSQAACPSCGQTLNAIVCLHCQTAHPLARW